MKKYIFLLFTLACVSCTDYLDIKPYDRTIPQSTDDYSALIHKMCDGIDKGDYEWVAGNFTLTVNFESFADNMETNLSDADSRLDDYVGTYLSDKQRAYSNLYEQIRNSNIVLDNYQDGRDTREGQDIIGTAYAIRGVCYYQLLRMFCAPPLADDAKLGVPLVTEFDMEAKPVRSTIQETIAQVESDLKAALACDIQEPMYRFNNDVINGYLARLYHWCGRWQEARDLAVDLLAKYPLLSGDDYVAMMTTQYGLKGNRLFMANLFSYNPLTLSDLETDLQKRPLSARYTSLFAEGTNDIRRKNNLFFNRKRKNKKLLFSDMRSAEFALIAMECAYHLGDNATALQELNNFRKNRITGMYIYNNLTLPAVDANELIQVDALGNPLTPLLQAILNERRKEFYLENGDRWFELKRNGRPEWWVAVPDANDNTKYWKYWTRKYMYTWPIPVEDIQQNPDLIQNPGYEETYH